LSGFYNAMGGRRIRMRDQVIISYCGLRGAVCYALATMMDPESIIPRDCFISITIVLILWTIFVQVRKIILAIIVFAGRKILENLVKIQIIRGIKMSVSLKCRIFIK
jgi:NhaP-type Na+/H+ or K+/H+ antiporter